MTDDKIIRVEKLIKTLHAYCFCSQTTYRAMGYKFCEDDFICLKELIDLINRQKAEIERYKGVIKLLESDVKNAKSEAIKDFAVRLKSRFMYNETLANFIDNVLKEMTEVGE